MAPPTISPKHSLRWISLSICLIVLGIGALWLLVFSPAISVSAVSLQPAKVSEIKPGDLNAVCICDITTSTRVFFRISNRGLVADRLVHASSPAATQAVLQRSVNDESGVYVETLQAVEVAPLSEVSFAPGAYVLSLQGLKNDLNPGDLVQVALTFEKQGVVTLPGVVERAEN